MNIEHAFHVFGFEIEDYHHVPLSHLMIKKQYYKLALQYHPDKNTTLGEIPGESSVVASPADKMKEINEAYSCIKEYMRQRCGDDVDDEEDDEDEDEAGTRSDWKNTDEDGIQAGMGSSATATASFDPSSYDLILYNLLRLFKVPNPEVTTRIIKRIICSCENSIKSVLAEMKEKENQETLEVLENALSFVEKYHNIFHISFEIIKKIREYLKKGDKPSVIGGSPEYSDAPPSYTMHTIHPKLKDLIEENIYKYSDKIYVPLWGLNRELVFDIGVNAELIFQIIHIPNTNAYYIDDNTNDIYIQASFDVADIFHKDVVEVVVDDCSFSLNVKDLHLMKQQTIVLKEKGIPKYNDLAPFDTSFRSDVFVEVFLGIKTT